MHVRKGDDPRYAEDDVVFRATHYFRVFDYCRNDPSRATIPGSDSLYRFRMTGANTSTVLNKIHFESGTLRASEIDPLGARVDFDADGRPHFVSQAQTQADQQVHDTLKRIRLLSQMQRDLPPAQSPPATNELAASDSAQRLALSKAITSEIERLMPPPITAASGVTPPTAASSGVPAEKTPAAACAIDNRRQGFQIMGPEGWRSFDQDERLILAMSSSGEPLFEQLRAQAQVVLANASASGGVSPLQSSRQAADIGNARAANAHLDAATDRPTLTGAIDELRAALGIGGAGHD
jgi:hypothetical protein